MSFDLDDQTLRELQRVLGRTAVALVRTERQMSKVMQALYPGHSAERGDEIRIAEVEFAGGQQWFVPQLYEGPAGGHYRARPGYVLSCVAPAGVRLRRHWHPDVTEYVLVQRGELVNVVSGKRLGPGQGFVIALGETHQFFFPEETEFTVSYALASNGDADQAADEQGGNAVFEDVPAHD